MSTATSAQGRDLPAGEYWFEDIEIGDRYGSGGIIVTEAHVAGFAGLSGDFFDVHMDDDFARDLGFPGRIAHGLLGLAMTDGLKNRCGVKTMNVATLNWNWNFKAPILIGDRIEIRQQIRDKRLTKRPDRGILTVAIEVFNQHGTVVQSGETLLMVRARGDKPA